MAVRLTCLLVAIIAVLNHRSLAFDTQINAQRGPSAKTLESFEEPALSAIAAQDAEIYRVIAWPIFASPVSVRIEKRGDGIHMTAKRLSGQGGYNPGAFMEEVHRKVSEKEWERLLHLLETANFWTEESEEKPIDAGRENVRICLDGTTWIVEGIKEGRYHFVDRYCPASEKLLVSARAFLKLSRFKINLKEY